MEESGSVHSDGGARSGPSTRHLSHLPRGRTPWVVRSCLDEVAVKMVKAGSHGFEGQPGRSQDCPRLHEVNLRELAAFFFGYEPIMNLMHLLAKRDRNLVLKGDVVPAKQIHGAHTYQGLNVPAGSGAEVRLRNALKWYPFNARPTTAGWLGVIQAGYAGGTTGSVSTAFVDQSQRVMAQVTQEIGPVPTTLDLPYLPAPADLAEQQNWDLVIRNTSASQATLTILVTETVPTPDFYDQAVGTGVEIGPGPNPRITPRNGRTVYYVERETAEAFREKYSFSGKFDSLDSDEARAYWSKVIVGRANDIPFEDGSLDFIFSADVIEHLVNPLGHLEYWSRKLAPRGRVLAIIPHIFGCGDYRNRPTPFADWLTDYERGGYEETLNHHQPFALARGLDAAALMARGYSSHFSFFNTENLAHMLEFACSALGYRGYNIYYGRNSKKIHFGLYKP
jgi:SAM-dependent methyltransferase